MPSANAPPSLSVLGPSFVVLKGPLIPKLLKVVATAEPAAAIFSEITTVVPTIDKTLGIGEVGIPVPDTFCPTLIPTALTTVIDAEFLAHVPLVVGLP